MRLIIKEDASVLPNHGYYEVPFYEIKEKETYVSKLCKAEVLIFCRLV